MFGDFDGDGQPDLFVPQATGCKLFRNEGKFKFDGRDRRAGPERADRPGDLRRLGRRRQRRPARTWSSAACAAATATSATRATAPSRTPAKIGLNSEVFNTQAVCLADLNGDGVLDMVFNNEGQDPSCCWATRRRWRQADAGEPGVEGEDGRHRRPGARPGRRGQAAGAVTQRLRRRRPRRAGVAAGALRAAARASTSSSCGCRRARSAAGSWSSPATTCAGRWSDDESSHG